MASEENSEREPRADIAALEIDVGVRDGFFKGLLTAGDDWSFVIKMHALVEAAVSHLLTEVLGHSDLHHVFSYLELSNNRTGKLAFAKALGCLEDGERHTVRKLSELRNQLVHDVSNVDFDFQVWVAKLDKNQLKQYAEAFGPGGETISVGDNVIPSLEFFRQNPKINIWFACLFLLSLVYQRKDLARLKRDVERQRASLLDSLMRGDTLAPPSK